MAIDSVTDDSAMSLKATVSRTYSFSASDDGRQLAVLESALDFIQGFCKETTAQNSTVSKWKTALRGPNGFLIRGVL